MFPWIKTLFASQDRRDMRLAEADFDALMAQLDKDHSDLDQVAHQIEDEFDDLQDEVDSMTKKVDQVAGQEVK